MNKKQLIFVLFSAISIYPCIVFAKVVENDSSWKTSAGAAAMAGVDIKKATGYDWLEWPRNKKLALMTAMFDFYNLDKNVYSIEKGIDTLDIHYYAAHQKSGEGLSDAGAVAYYEAPCLFTFGTIVGDKEGDWGIKSLDKDE